MKQNVFKNIRLIGFGAVLALGLSLAQASWNEPTNGPTPNASTTTAASSTELIGIPVNSGPISQIKAQGLSVEEFLATGNAQFDQQVFAADTIHGCGPVANPADPNCTDVENTTVFFGGNTGGTLTKVGIESTGTMYVAGTIQSSILSNPSSSRICANEFGTLILCR